MNIRKSVFTNTMSSVVLIVLACFASASSLASDSCQRFHLTSYVTLLSPAGPAVGTAEAVLEDGTVLQITASGEITATHVNANGIIHMRVRELDDWGPLGTTIGLDKLKLIPTAIPGEFELTIKTFILGESGALEDVYGFYRGTGTASFNNGMLTHSGRGRVCNLPFDSDDDSDE